MHEQIEHTADVGLRVQAASLDALFAEAGEGFMELIVPNLADVRPNRSLNVDLASDRLEDLFCDWLGELLYIFETERLVLCRFAVQVNGDLSSLHGRVEGAPLDTNLHQLGYEIKAVTYHQLRLERTDTGWLAEVTVDI